MAEPTLYLFDGYNLLHAGGFEDARELSNRLASFVALRGARGVVVFDGVGRDESLGPLDVRYAADADALIERLAAEHRDTERVCLVSSDAVVRRTTGQEVISVSSTIFAAGLSAARHEETQRRDVESQLDPETRNRLERLRRSGS